MTAKSWDGAERRRKPSPNTECETCDFHSEFVENVAKSVTDVKWIKWLVCALLTITGTALLSLWGVLVPWITNIQNSIHVLDATVQVHSGKIADLKVQDEESKSDRKAIRELMGKLHEKP